MVQSKLIIFNLFRFEVILEMDWLSQYHAYVDYFDKRVAIKSTEWEDFSFRSPWGSSFPCIISTMQELHDY